MCDRLDHESSPITSSRNRCVAQADDRWHITTSLAQAYEAPYLFLSDQASRDLPHIAQDSSSHRKIQRRGRGEGAELVSRRMPFPVLWTPRFRRRWIGRIIRGGIAILDMRDGGV